MTTVKRPHPASHHLVLTQLFPSRDSCPVTMAKENARAIFEARRAINEAKAALKKVVQGRIEKKRIIVRGTDLIPVWQTYPSQPRKKNGKPKSRARILRAIVRTPLRRVRNISY